jgi:hypothetical protein
MLLTGDHCRRGVCQAKDVIDLDDADNLVCQLISMLVSLRLCLAFLDDDVDDNDDDDDMVVMERCYQIQLGNCVVQMRS